MKNQNLYYILFFFLTCFLSHTSYSQTSVLQKNWAKLYGDRGEDKFHAVTEATNGTIIAVGETTLSSTGKDGLVVMSNYNTGQEILRKNYGDKKIDKLVAVAQTLDGHFYLAGTKEALNKQKKEAWLLKINTSGKVIMEKTYGTAEDDSFEDMVIMNDGSVAAAGIYNGQKDGDVWLANIVNGKKEYEISLGNDEYESITAMTKLADGSLVLVGNAKKSSKAKKGDIWIQRVELSAKRKRWIANTPTFMGGKNWDEASDVIATNDGGYLVTGFQTVDRQELDAWMIKFDAYNNKLWEETEGGGDTDIAYAAVQTDDDGYLLVGSSKSEKSGARYSKMWVVKTDRGGAKEWSRYFGGNKNDIGKAVCVVHDGTIAIAGMTESYEAKGQDAWLMRLQAANRLYKNFLSDNLNITADNFRVNTKTNTLKKGDKTYLAFDIKNKESADITDIQFKVNALASVEGIKYWNQNYIGTLRSGQQKTVYIPVEATTQLEQGATNLVLSMSSGRTPLKTFKTTVESTISQAARIAYQQHQFSLGNNATEILSLDIKNEGDFPTKKVEVRVSYPSGIQAVDGQTRILSNIPPKSTQKAKFTFKLTDTYRSDKVSITCTVKENGLEKVKQVVIRGGQASNGLASTLLILTNPDPDEMDISKIQTDKSKFKFTAKAISASIAKPEDFKVYVDNVPLDNSKFGEKELSPPVSENNNLNSRNFTASIPLNLGENRIRVTVKNPLTGEEVEAKTMIVDYNPGKANLHILAIGPSHGDLKYTGKDAQDFAEAYRGQEGKLFNRIFINQLTTTASTEKNKILESLYDLKRRYNNDMVDNKVSSRDVVLVFISSHGMKDTRTGEFKLLPSDYDPSYGSVYAIDYKTQVLNILNEMTDCKKVVLIDACQSGAAKSGTLSKSLIKINETVAGLSTIASCQENQLSYEDDLWKNGAFTEAILEAFENKRCSDENGIFQASSDAEITIKELYQFLQRRVPGLIRTYKKDSPTEQIPHRPFNQLNEDMPIFFVN